MTGPVRVQLADARLDRICGLPVHSLPDSTATRRVLNELDAATRAERDAAPALTDAIHDVVPACAADVRRRVLQARRSVHAGRAMAPDDPAVLLAAGVPDLELKTWLDAHDRRSRATAVLESTVTESVAAGGIGLRALLAVGPVARTLSIVAPEFLSHRGSARWRPGDRAARTAWLYAMRAAWKPSPLGHFTSVSLSPAGDAATARTQVPIGLVHRIFTALAADPDFADAFDYRCAPAATTPAGGPAAIVGSVSGRDGFLWRQERTVRLDAYEQEWAALRRSVDPGADPSAELSPARRGRYLAMGLLTPRVPWSPGSDRALPELAGALRASRSVRAPDIADALEELHARAGAVAGAPDRSRTEQMAAVGGMVSRLTSAVGAPAWTDTVLHEDVSTPDRIGALPEPVHADLRRLAELVRPAVVRSLAYDVLLAAFRDRVGVAGRVPDAAAFFAVLAGDPTVVQAVHQARRDDLTVPAGSPRAWLPVGRTSAPPALSIHYQLAARDRAALDAGDYRLVVNQCGSALGGLLTRFHRVLPAGAVADALLPWWQRLYPEGQVRGMSVSASVNSLQHNGCGALPEMAWPFEFSSGTGLDRVGLRHDPATDTLEFLDADGVLVAPVYTGIVPATLCTGAAQLALLVADPWVDSSVITRQRHPFLRLAAAQAITEPVASPRAEVGRLVLARAGWQLPAADFPRPERAETDAGYLIRLDQWRRARDLPEQVFLVAVSTDPFDGQRRKPLRLDFADPFAVRAALPLIDGACGLRLEEVLPAAADVWFEAPDGRRVVEHISMLAWDRPVGTGTS